MKGKKFILCIFIFLITVSNIFLIYFICIKKNLVNIYEVYTNSYEMLEKNEKKDINITNTNENIVYSYFETIYNKINENKDNLYDNYISENVNPNFYANFNDISDKLKSNSEEEENLIKELKEYSDKDNFINYLKKNKVNFIYINYLKDKIRQDKIYDLEKTKESLNVDEGKYKKLIEYADYLKENKDNWYYKGKRVYSKNVDLLNVIKENNENLGITGKVVMEEKSNKNIPVLMYHGVSDETWGIANLFMKVEDFENQLKYIHDNFKTIFIEDIEDYYGDEKVVALTFDDGYEDFYRNVLPLLKKYEIKANLYIIVGNKGGKYLTDEQILEINESGLVSIGSHTINHNDLSKLSGENLVYELKNSKEEIENLLGKEIKTICYPAGKYNEEVLNETAKYYEYGLIIGGTVQKMDNNFDPVAIKRFRIYRSTGFDNFKKIVNTAN